MSLFAKYNQLNTQANDLDGERELSGPDLTGYDHSFEMDRPIEVFSGKVTISF